MAIWGRSARLFGNRQGRRWAVDVHSKAGMVSRLGAGEGVALWATSSSTGNGRSLSGGDCTNLIGVLDTLRENVGRAGLAFTAARPAGS